MSNMVGEGRAGYAQLFLNLTYREPFIARTHQQPNNFQSGRVTDFSENVGGVFEFHAAIIGLVNRQVNLITRNIEIRLAIRLILFTRYPAWNYKDLIFNYLFKILAYARMTVRRGCGNGYIA
jgi:hypothetical protein